MRESGKNAKEMYLQNISPHFYTGHEIQKTEENHGKT